MAGLGSAGEGNGKDRVEPLKPPGGLTFALSWPSASWAHHSLPGQEGADEPGPPQSRVTVGPTAHPGVVSGTARAGCAGPPFPLRSLPLPELPPPSPRDLEKTLLGGQRCQ